MPRSRACATGLRTTWTCSKPGSAMSSMKRPAPRSSVAASSRLTARPMKVRSPSIVATRASFTPSRPLDLLHDRAPLGEFFLEVLVGPVGAVAEHRLEAGLDELAPEILVGPLLLRHLVEPLQDRLRRGDRRENAEEDLRHEIVEAFLVRGRDVGRRFEPRRRVDREDAQPAAAVKRNHLRGDVGEDDL